MNRLADRDRAGVRRESPGDHIQQRALAAAVWPDDPQPVAPRDAQLEQWAERLTLLYAAGVDLYGYMHNPYEGHSPASLDRLCERLTGRIPLPAWPPPGFNVITSGKSDSTDQDESSTQMSLF